MNMKKSSFEPSILWAIFLCVVIFAMGYYVGYLRTDQSLKVDNASLRAVIPGGQTVVEERKALERREEEVKRRENNADQRDKDQDQRDKDYDKKIGEFSSSVRLTGKAEGKAEQLSKNNEVIKQSFDGVVWQRNILWIVVIILVVSSLIGGCTMFLYIRKLQYSIDNRDRAIEVTRVQIYNPSGTIEQIKTAFETSTQFIEPEQISKQKLLKSSSESEEYMT
jgi:uncharacterized membrane protein